MKERERGIVTSLVLLMLILWIGFLIHRSSRFAGSLMGGLLGVSGGLLMILPIVYSLVKRVKRIKNAVTKIVKMPTLLVWHIYAGLFGPILVILHTGHKFESHLGVLLTAMVLLVVLSGFIGRYLMKEFSRNIREKKGLLHSLQNAYKTAAMELTSRPDDNALLTAFSGLRPRPAFFFHNALESGRSEIPPSIRAIYLVESMADVEYAIKTHERFKKWFAKWLKFHLVISVILYLLMTLHIWAAIHFGLRWSPPNTIFSSNQTPTAVLSYTAPTREAKAEETAQVDSL